MRCSTINTCKEVYATQHMQRITYDKAHATKHICDKAQATNHICNKTYVTKQMQQITFKPMLHIFVPYPLPY